MKFAQKAKTQTSPAAACILTSATSIGLQTDAENPPTLHPIITFFVSEIFPYHVQTQNKSKEYISKFPKEIDTDRCVV